MIAVHGRKPLEIAVVALVLVASFLMVGTRSSSSATNAEHEAIDWRACGDGGYQCAMLPVPIDYSKPSGPSIHIALTRKPATSGLNRGSVVVNAGTQNGGGTDFVQQFPQAFAEINRFHDVIGLDTRGVGHSSPLVSCVTYAEERRIEAPLSAAQTTADREQRIKEATGLASKCQQRSGRLLPHLSSTTSARDLDRVRAALGERQLRLVTAAGGSTLAENYLALFPDRVAALVLDSPFDTPQYIERPFAFDIDQSVATEETMSTFFAWCKSNEELCTFGDGHPRRAFTALLDKTRKNRLSHPGRWDVLTDGALVDLVSGAMLFPQQWPDLAKNLAGAEEQAVPMVPLKQGDDRAFAEFYSQTCLDRTFPDDPARFDDQLRRSKHVAPLIGGRYGYAEFKCYAWPTEATERLTGSWSNPHGVPVLVLSADDDPLAPHTGARRTASRLGASTVDVHGSGSIQLGRHSCIDTTAAMFLTIGWAPKRTTCTTSLPGASS
ncbi:alpha/beta fold hydrolase [Solicola gregarius]|uniref:Alpha/beta hydrolase n=1 Tax=Solicola gregarius TaxID=2908642 RepID=A0AA46YK48_9ACTN|nr:alpha/beta fold hydrolase [Solicola gregarius]UYM03643.1 alpha/beta hydrolase [Solicola gregarius]